MAFGFENLACLRCKSMLLVYFENLLELDV